MVRGACPACTQSLTISRHETRCMVPPEPDVFRLAVVPLSKLTSMMPPTKIGAFGSELKPTPAAATLVPSESVIMSLPLTKPSPLSSKKFDAGLVPVNGSKAMIQPRPDGLHMSVTSRSEEHTSELQSPVH